MKEIKFATKVAMKVTAEQYHRDLEKPLLDMGYVYMDYFIPVENMKRGYRHLTNSCSCLFSIQFNTRTEVDDYYLIEDYNPQLFLALAAMTEEGEDRVETTWMMLSEDNTMSNEGFGTSPYLSAAYRKATKEEIIKHFNKKVMGNKFKVGDRFPFKLTEEDTKRIINIACEGWKLKLSKKWGKDILLKGYTEVSEDFYNDMRSYCTDGQHILLDDIFGKDEEFIPDGTPCLVRDSVQTQTGWVLRYSNGKGEFYLNSKKYGETHKWEHYQVLDINNLPVNA